MENKIIVLGSILAVSAVTIALCVMGKKKEEVKSNATGGRSKKYYTTRDGEVIPSNTIYGNGTNCDKGDSTVDVGGIGQPSDIRCTTKKASIA